MKAKNIHFSAGDIPVSCESANARITRTHDEREVPSIIDQHWIEMMVPITFEQYNDIIKALYGDRRES